MTLSWAVFQATSNPSDRGSFETTSVSYLDGYICLLVSLSLFWPVKASSETAARTRFSRHAQAILSPSSRGALLTQGSHNALQDPPSTSSIVSFCSALASYPSSLSPRLLPLWAALQHRLSLGPLTAHCFSSFTTYNGGL